MKRRQFLGSTLAAFAAVSVPFAQAQSGPRVFRIGHQKGWLSLLKARGTLEKRLSPLGVSVTWTEFVSGPVQLEALNVGSIDFGDVGEAPPIFAQAAGAPLFYVAATEPRPRQEAVIVPAGSPLKTIGDLRGKKIALNKGSNVHYFLLKLLQKNGLNYSDVQIVFLPPPDARAAFERGAVDAWVIWDPFLASAQKVLNAQVLADATGVASNRWYYFSSKDYAYSNQDVLRIAVDEVSKIDAWISKNQSAASTELSQILGLDKEIVDLFLGRQTFGTVGISSAIIKEQQQIADAFLELKLIPKKLDLVAAGHSIHGGI